jgi:hypothetical protein
MCHACRRLLFWDNCLGHQGCQAPPLAWQRRRQAVALKPELASYIHPAAPVRRHLRYSARRLTRAESWRKQKRRPPPPKPEPIAWKVQFLYTHATFCGPSLRPVRGSTSECPARCTFLPGHCRTFGPTQQQRTSKAASALWATPPSGCPSRLDPRRPPSPHRCSLLAA